MNDIIIKLFLGVLGVILVVFLLLPDFFPFTNIDEFFASAVLLAILAKFGVKVI